MNMINLSLKLKNRRHNLDSTARIEWFFEWVLQHPENQMIEKELKPQKKLTAKISENSINLKVSLRYF